MLVGKSFWVDFEFVWFKEHVWSLEPKTELYSCRWLFMDEFVCFLGVYTSCLQKRTG